MSPTRPTHLASSFPNTARLPSAVGLLLPTVLRITSTSFQRLLDVAEKAKIPIQHEAASRFTGTDADSIYHIRQGIPTALVSLPLRYMHSVVETADLGDVEQVIELLSEFARSVKSADEFAIQL